MHYMYIDRLLDSSLPHNLIQEYTQHEAGGVKIPTTITEESSLNGTPAATPGARTPGSLHEPGSAPLSSQSSGTYGTNSSNGAQQTKVKRTPKNLYKVPETDENTPLLSTDNAVHDDDDEEAMLSNPKLSEWVPEEDEDTDSPIVKVALYTNLAANTALLILKIIVAVMTSSLSVVASLVDAALDFLSTGIIWVTSWMIARQDRYAYPVGRRRLEPIGVLVFSVIMITSFCQVGIEGLSRLSGPDHTIVSLTVPAVAIMASTVVIKGLCWLWCRLIRNSSVQALAQDAMTDVVFNTFSILFPLVGYFARVWWLDALGGILLSAYVIINWSRTSAEHIRNLTGASATADERNILLYMTMRFAKSIKRIQGLQAYHAGDKLNVEVDIVVDEHLALRDSHDLGESLQYVLGKSYSFKRTWVLLTIFQKVYHTSTVHLSISITPTTISQRTCRSKSRLLNIYSSSRCCTKIYTLSCFHGLVRNGAYELLMLKSLVHKSHSHALPCTVNHLNPPPQSQTPHSPPQSAHPSDPQSTPSIPAPRP
jgi:cation diffusion facilitator family transporter